MPTPDPRASPDYRSSDWNAQHEKYCDEWQSIMHQLFLMAHLIRKQFDPRFSLPDDHVPQMISKVSTLILHSYPCPMTTTHQREINGFYILVMENYSWFHHQTLSQKQLLNLVELMMEQNVNLRLNLNHTFWIRFFTIFHKLPIQYSDILISDLLCLMTMHGSKVTPNLEIFNVILNVISMNQGMDQNGACKVVDDLIEHIMPQNGIEPNEESFRCQFRVHQRNNNVNGMMRLIMSHQDIVFEGVSIQTINTILGRRSFFEMYDYQILVSEILPLYGIQRNMETYHLLQEQLEHRFNAPEISDAELNHINELIVSQEPLAWSPRSDLQSRFDGFLQSQDLGGISKLMLSKRDITFRGLTVRTFNTLLYCFNLIGDYRNEITHLTMMITGIMPQYGLTANVETYLVLRSLCKEFPDIAHDIRSIPQPNPAYPPIGVIIERLTQIHRVKRGYLYCTVAHFIEDDADSDLPPEPDPLSLPNESTIWYQKVRHWIHSLSESESVCFQNVVRQSQLVDNLECRLQDGHCPSIFAWNRFFRRFYELPNEYPDEYILELLHTMEDSRGYGEIGKASSMTFAIIFQGIDKKEGIQCKEALKDRILNDSVYYIPSQIELMESLNRRLEGNTQGDDEKVMELADWMWIFEKFYDSRPGRKSSFPETYFWTLLMKMGQPGSRVWPKKKTFETLELIIPCSTGMSIQVGEQIRLFLCEFRKTFLRIVAPEQGSTSRNWKLTATQFNENYTKLMFRVLKDVWDRCRSRRVRRCIRRIAEQNLMSPPISEYLCFREEDHRQVIWL